MLGTPISSFIDGTSVAHLPWSGENGGWGAFAMAVFFVIAFFERKWHACSHCCSVWWDPHSASAVSTGFTSVQPSARSKAGDREKSKKLRSLVLPHNTQAGETIRATDGVDMTPGQTYTRPAYPFQGSNSTQHGIRRQSHGTAPGALHRQYRRSHRTCFRGADPLLIASSALLAHQMVRSPLGN